VPARQAFIVELVPPEDLVSAAAINSTTYNLARVVGPAIAGLLVAWAGPGAAFAVNAVSYVAVLIGLSRIRKQYRAGGLGRTPVGVHRVAVHRGEVRCSTHSPGRW
jgi:MFS family permease